MRDEVAELADRIEERRRRGQDYEAEYVLKALLVLQVERAPGMSLTEAIGSGHIGVMEVVETIRRTDVT